MTGKTTVTASPDGRAPLEWTQALSLAALLLVAAVAYSKMTARKPVAATAAATRTRTNTDRGDKDQSRDASEEPRPIEPLPDHDYRRVVQPKLRPFKPIYHITMALRNTTPQELITIDPDYPSRIDLRRSLIASKGPGVHGVVPDSRGAAAARELYSYLLTENLPQRYPGIFQYDALQGTTHNTLTGQTVPATITDMSDAAATAAMATLGTTVEEDLFVLVQEPEGHHRCVAFMCCFPSGFDPASKLGLGLEAIHGPVPSYHKIGPSMERFFGRLEYGKPVCRLNWSVQTHGDLHNVASNHIKTEEEEFSDADVDVSETYLRVEYQTLTRLRETKALLFSFKTYLYPLADVRAEGQGPEFADAIEGLAKGNAPGMWRYKAAVRWGPKACAFLRS